jgi:F-type H+-transporting ATPase subunit epsilon
MPDTFHFDLVSPARLVLSGEVTQVDVPGAEGDFGVLAGHAPTVAALKPGILTVFGTGAPQRFVVFGGFAEVSPEGLTILAEVAVPAGEADRGLIATRIQELEASRQNLARAESFDERKQLDRAIERLDHYQALDRQLTGGTGTPAAH